MRSVVVFERSCVAAAHHDVELIAERVERLRRLQVKQGDKSIASAFIGGAAEDRIVGHQRVAGKIHLRDQARGERGAEDREMNVCGAPGVVVILPRIGAGLDGDEAIAAFGVGDGVTAAGEVGIKRSVVLIDGVGVAASGVGLPDFDERVRKRAAVFVDDAAGDDDALADGFGVVLFGEVEGFYVDEVVVEDGASDFGEGVREMDERLGRGAFLGGDVGSVEVFGLRAGVIAAIGADGHWRSKLETRNSKLETRNSSWHHSIRS